MTNNDTFDITIASTTLHAYYPNNYLYPPDRPKGPLVKFLF